LKFVLGETIDEINRGEIEEDSALLNAFFDEIKYYKTIINNNLYD